MLQEKLVMMSCWADSHIVVVVVVIESQVCKVPVVAADVVVIEPQVCKVLREKLGVQYLVGLTATLL